MSIEIHLRKAEINDADQIYKLVCQLTDKRMDRNLFHTVFTKNIHSNQVFYSVAEVNGRVQGFISMHIQDLLHHQGQVAEIQELCIDENYRSLGIGKMLLEEMVLEAQKQNCELIELAASKKREDAHRFYEREGWERSHYKFTRKLV